MASCVKTSTKQTGKPNASDCDAVHVLILVPGTTDPVNTNTNKAISYTSVNQYWDAPFYNSIKEYVNQKLNFELFDWHGWSGDNRIANRETAGKYLVNRLIGGTIGGKKLSAFYEEAAQNSKMYFHLLGHSHGGNVMNEMTKEIDALGDKWPEKWKIKSLIYLSTPFFKELHKVKYSESFFHPKAEVFNARSDYDMTQRMLADFSLHPIYEGVMAVKPKSAPLITSLGDLKARLNRIPIDILKPGAADIAESIIGFVSPILPADMIAVDQIPYNDGVKLYTATSEFFEEFVKLLESTKVFVQETTKKYTYKPAASEDPSGSLQSRTLLTKKIADDFDIIFNQLIGDLKSIRINLDTTLKEKKLTKEKFSRLGYVSSLVAESSPFLTTLVKLLNINPITLQTNYISIWNLLYQLLDHNIEAFDNTYQNPARQLTGTKLASSILDFPVMDRDAYYGSLASALTYPRFMQRIELAESNYETNPSQSTLLDLLFLLIAQEGGQLNEQMESIGKLRFLISALEYPVSGKPEVLLQALNETLGNIETVIKSRRYSGESRAGAMGHIVTKFGLIDERSVNPDPYSSHQPGSLPYLFEESHSTSRRVLHCELEEFLDKVGPQC
jgi:hypothetical protein